MSARALGLLALVGLGAPLVALAVVGLSSRYAADDYCTAGQVQMAGFLDAQARLYAGWSGRFSATLILTLLEVLGSSVVPLLPALALLAWVASLTWATRAIFSALGWDAKWLTSGVLAVLVVFATLQTTADLPQVLFWQTGMVTYLWPLVLATLYTGWVAHAGAVRWPVAVGVSFVLALLAGGTSETMAAAQVTALALACIVAYLAGARSVRSTLMAMLLAGLLGALLALVIVAVAPGNTVRQETAVQTPLAIALPQALEFTQGWLRLTFARPHAAVLLLLIGIPAATGAATARRASASPPRLEKMPGLWSQWLLPAAGVAASALVILACMLPAFYALGSNPPGRAQVIPEYVLICSLASLGWLLGTAIASGGPADRGAARPGSRWANWVAVGGLVVLLGLGPLFSTRDVLQQLGSARAYAAAWDQLDREVRTERIEGVQDVTVRPLQSTGLVQNLDFVGPNREDWFNACVARYYGLDSIASTLSVP